MKTDLVTAATRDPDTGEITLVLTQTAAKELLDTLFAASGGKQQAYDKPLNKTQDMLIDALSVGTF